MEKEAFFKIQYGLYLLTCREGSRVNGCIINTCMQITEDPYRILFALSDSTYTAELLRVGEACNVSVLSTKAPYELYRHFGYQSGRDVDKFAGRDDPCDALGLPYPGNGEACVTICGTVSAIIPCGTHSVYVVSVKEARILSNDPAVTYEEYHRSIKPKKPLQAATDTSKKGYVCRVCGYVYEGDTLPPDYTCPICHHGADSFEEIK